MEYRTSGLSFPSAKKEGGQCLADAGRLTVWLLFFLTAARQSRNCTGFPVSLRRIGYKTTQTEAARIVA